MRPAPADASAVAMLSRSPRIGLIGAVRTAERAIEALTRRNIASAALRFTWRSSHCVRIGRYARLCLRLSHRRCGWLWRRAGHPRHVRLLHEIFPYLCWKQASGDALHRTVIVIADPDADDEDVFEPDEPGIPVVLGGPSLAGGKAVERGGAAGATFDHSAQQTNQLSLVLSETVLRLICAVDRHIVGGLRGPDAGNAIRRDGRLAGAHGRIGRGEIELGHLARTKRERWIVLQPRVQSEIACGRDHLADADLLCQPNRGIIERIGKCVRKRALAVIAMPVILGMPAR